jgi:hypothetical protein
LLISASSEPTLLTDAGEVQLRPGMVAGYPADDLQAVMGDDGQWRFTRKDDTAC